MYIQKRHADHHHRRFAEAMALWVLFKSLNSFSVVRHLCACAIDERSISIEMCNVMLYAAAARPLLHCRPYIAIVCALLSKSITIYYLMSKNYYIVQIF